MSGQVPPFYFDQPDVKEAILRYLGTIEDKLVHEVPVDMYAEIDQKGPTVNELLNYEAYRRVLDEMDYRRSDSPSTKPLRYFQLKDVPLMIAEMFYGMLTDATDPMVEKEGHFLTRNNRMTGLALMATLVLMPMTVVRALR